MKTPNILKVALLSVATLATITINALANILPINGLNTGQLSDKYPVLFTPAGYVFSIWGLIYFALIAFTIYASYSIIKNPESKQVKIIEKITLPYLVSALANSLWIVAWHYEKVWLSVLIMAVLLASLVSIYYLLINEETEGRLFRWTVKGTFSLYLGWISVATIANITVLLYVLGWNGFGIAGEYWSAIMIVIAGVLGVMLLAKYRDYIFNAVLIWAIIGIIFKYDGYAPIVTAGIITVLAICGVAAWKEAKKLKSKS